MNIKISLTKAADLINSETSRLDAEILLSYVLSQERSYLYANWDYQKIIRFQLLIVSG